MATPLSRRNWMIRSFMFAESNPPCDADVNDDNNGHSNAVRPVASSKSSQVLHAVVWFEYCGYDDVEGWYIWCRDRKTCIPFWYFGDGVADCRHGDDEQYRYYSKVSFRLLSCIMRYIIMTSCR